MEVKKTLLPLAALLFAVPASAHAATYHGDQKTDRTTATSRSDVSASHGPVAGRSGGRRVH
jgi:hypothetical protein